MAKLAAVVTLLFLAAGCRTNPSDKLAKLTEEFVNTTLSFSPSAATSAGLHQYQKQKLDDLLDDMSASSLDKQQKFYEGLPGPPEGASGRQTDAGGAADVNILEDQTALALLDLTAIHTALHNPTMYVETLGNALFNPFVLEYAPKPQRIRSIIARLEKTPLYLDQASSNLVSAPRDLGAGRHRGKPGKYRPGGQDHPRRRPRRTEGRLRAGSAPGARRDEQVPELSEDEPLGARRLSDWQLGQELYTRKFRYVLESGVEADTMLDNAERDLQRVRAHMFELALPLHREMAPAHKDHAELSGDARQNAVSAKSWRRSRSGIRRRESYMDDARKDLDEARAFVQEKHLLKLPARSNLQVIPTPEFMRGIYAVGGFNPAPALEPQLGAFYWVTPIPENWPNGARRIQTARVQLLQAEAADHSRGDARPLRADGVRQRRAAAVAPRAALGLRQRPVYRGLGAVRHPDDARRGLSEPLAGNGADLREGRAAGDRQRHSRRPPADAGHDGRGGARPDDAADLSGEGRGDRRSCSARNFRPCQLPMYFVGWRGWIRVRDEYQEGERRRVSTWPHFNDQALKEGAVPLPVLGRLLK